MMTERGNELRRLAEKFRDHDAVTGAFLAKSFTDRLVIIDLQGDVPMPRDIAESLEENDLKGVNEVYADVGGEESFAGTVGNATRHQFVDIRTRGDHQSYVIE